MDGKNPRLWALMVLVFAAAAAWAAPEKKDDKQENEEAYRVKIPAWRFVKVNKQVPDLRELTGDKQKKAVEELKKATVDAGDGKTASQLKPLGQLFHQYGFEAVEKIAKAKSFETPGSKPGATVGQDMAVMRRQMINQAMAEAVKKVDPDGKLTIGMLDSGNKNSGIASDVDQTIFVTPKDLANKVGVTVEDVIKQFNAEFEAKFGCHPEKMGIECMNGNDFYPDWRQRHSKEVLSAEARRVVHEKRKNPEAYRSEGELKIQAEGRGWQALQEHHQRVDDLDKAKTLISEIKGKGKLSAADEAKIRQIEADLLKKYAGDYPAKSIGELETKFHKDSPWTEVRNNPGGEPHVSQMEDPKGKVLKAKPELAKRFAFDGSWDNWIMYEHHPHNRRKYLLRSIAEGPGLMRFIEEGKPLTTFEYEKVYAGKNSETALKNFLHQTYRGKGGQPPLSSEQVDRFKMCLDVAARERLRHKGEGDFKNMTDKQVWGPYWPEMSDREKKIYADVPEEVLKKMMVDRATRAWEMDAREIMMENLIRTVSEPAKLLTGPEIRAGVIKGMAGQHPKAKQSLLKQAVREQLYAGIHDLISTEHAKELTADPETKKTLPPRNKDLVDRLLLAVAGTPYETEVRQIVADAAAARIRIEPGETKFRQAVYSYLADHVRARYESAGETYKTAKAKYAEFRNNPEYVARQMLYGAAERLAARAQTYKSWATNVAGFQTKKFTGLIPVKGPLPVEVEMRGLEFSGKKLLRNIRSPGNADSALMIMLAYQNGGTEAAVWAAGFEAVMNVPGVAQLNAVKDLVVHQQPQGVVMLGSAMAVPVLGQAFIFINIGKTGVTLLGNYVFNTLNTDTADMLYQGFLEQEAGWFTPGTKGAVRGQRVSLLHHVPIRVVQVPLKSPDGVTMKDDKGNVMMKPAWRRYSKEEAEKILGVFPDEYMALATLGILGGGDEWNSAYATVSNDITNPRGHFDAKRASMYYHFRDAIEPKLREKYIDVHEDEAVPIIHAFFMDYLDQWINARGAFSGFDENVLISRRFEVSQNLNNMPMRQKIATRATQDFIRSYYLIKGSVIDTKSIERATELRIREARDGDIIEEANMIIQAIHEARKLKPDLDMAQAFHAMFRASMALKRKEEEEKGRPYARVRPRVVRKMVPSEEDHHRMIPREAVEFLVSVVADPELHPPPYRIDVQWQTSGHTGEATGEPPELTDDEKRKQDQEQDEKIANGDNTDTLAAYVRVFDKNDNEIEIAGDIKMPIEIGELKVAKPQKGTRELKVAMRKKTKKAAADKPEAKPPTKPDAKPQQAFTVPTYELVYEDYDESKATSWGDKWEGEEVSHMDGQLWVRWEDCPLDMYYYVETEVSGGSPKYEKKNERELGAWDHFPDETPEFKPPDEDDIGEKVEEFEEKDERRNIFIIPFAWPQGHAGSFAIKGRILAFTKQYKGDAWKKEKPFAEYEFDEPFTIGDEREATEVDLMMRYGKAVEEDALAEYENLYDEAGRQYAKPQSFGPWKSSGGQSKKRWQFVTDYKKFDHMNATPTGYQWPEDSPNRGGAPVLWVTWKDAPPKMYYIYEVKIKGGSPPHQWSDFNTIKARRQFPPHEGRPKDGGNCFVIPLRYPVYHAGSFDIEGVLYAFKEYQQLQRSERQPKSWRDAIPEADYSFRSVLQISKIDCEGETGWATITPMGTVSGDFTLYGDVQRGRRLGTVTAGGKTGHVIIDGMHKFQLHNIGKISEISVKFPNYGQDMTIKIPIKLTPEDWKGPPTVDGEAVAKAQERIANISKEYKKPPDPGQVSWYYSTLAKCYVTNSEPIDFASFKAAKLQQVALMRQHLGTFEDADKKKRYHRSIARPLGEIGRYAIAMGDLATWKQYMSEAEAESIAGGQKPRAIDSARKGRLDFEAEFTFRQSGNLAASAALWDQAQAIAKSQAKDPATYKPRANPYVLDDYYETGMYMGRLMHIFRGVVQAAEKKRTTIVLQRTEPDLIYGLLQLKYIELDDDGNYRPTAAGEAAFKAFQENPKVGGASSHGIRSGKPRRRRQR